MKTENQKDISPFVYILVILFGSSTWLCVTGVWVELPLMVSVYQLPESWNLPSFLAVIVQLAIVGPLLYWLGKKFLPRYFSNSTPLIYACLSFAALSTLFLAIYWNQTSWVFGNERSTALFVLLFCISLVSCTSSLLYLPTMFRFRASYITAYFIGMGFGALVPSVLAIVQGSGRVICVASNSSSGNATFVAQAVEPYFGVSTFYWFMFVWMCLSAAAFVALNITAAAKREMNPYDDQTLKLDPHQSKLDNQEFKNLEDQEERRSLTPELVEGDYKSVDKPPAVKLVEKPSTTYLFLLLLTFWLCALMNGILPSIQSFACLPYGTTVFHVTVVLSNIANPLACFVPFFYTLRNVGAISIVAALATGLSAYIVVLAASSPTALFGETATGGVLCVLAWAADIALLAYLRAATCGLLRESGSERRLFWCGVSTQAGSFVGALIMFPLVNVYQYFSGAPLCPS